jgi:hypothetical protein
MKALSATLCTVTLSLLLLAGCSSPGVLISRQEKDSPPKMDTAPADGNYGLFIAGQQQELLEFPLKKGDPLGFDRGDEGPVHWMYAVAGNARNRLDVTQVYEWRRQP